MHFVPTPRSLALAALLLASCNPTEPQPNVTSEGSTTSATTAGPGTDPTTTAGPGTGQTTSTASTTASATTDPQTGSSGPCDFVCSPDVPGEGRECDAFAQDCPEGHKCAPYDQDGNGAWDSNKCVPVTGDGGHEDPCTANPVMEGGDDCAKGYMCWSLDEDMMGHCVALCTGTPDNPGCPHECTKCIQSGAGVPTPCLAECDPLSPDCVEGSLCIGDPGGEGFVCVLDASFGVAPVGTPCEFANVCNPGLFCASPLFFPYPGCEDSLGCCATFCDLAQGQGDQNPTCQALEGQVPGVECVPWSEDEPPPELCFTPPVGACGLPLP